MFYSCKKEKTNIVSKSETLAEFNEIALNDFFDVYLTEDSIFSIEVKTNEDLLEQITYRITDHVLTISNNQSLKWRNPQNNAVSLYISGIGLKKVIANETCNIRSLNAITTREFGIVLRSKANTADILLNNKVVFYWNDFPCGGKLTLSGTTKELKLWNTAIMSVDAKYLSCEKAFVDNNSKGNCEVNVSQRIEYSIEGEGDIIVYGNPAEIIEKSKNSSGEFILR